MGDDVIIKPIGSNVFDGRGPAKIVPIYLVTIESGKKETLFVATKFEDILGPCAKFTGFFTAETSEKVIESYQSVIESTTKDKYVEIMFPWSRVVSIRSLIFKQK